MGQLSPVKPKVFVALDVDSVDEAVKLAKLLKHEQVGFKLGPRLINRFGSSLISEIAHFGPVFVDLKFFDIPNTMLASLKAVSEAGASFATVHALCGPETLRQLREFEIAAARRHDFQILAVTVLTSMQQTALPAVLREHPVPHLVQSLSSDVLESGLRGVVASAQECGLIRAIVADAYVVTPGIRLAGADAHDQKRVVTPELAKESGASAIVVGRPVLEAADKRAALEKILTAFC